MALCYNEQLLDLEQYYDAIAYYRLSRYDGMKHESNSIANQRKLVRAYLQKHPNIHLVEEAQDDGYTGTNYDRPGFKRVLEAIQSKRVNCVIVKDLSRLGREYIETGKYLEMIFPSFGVRFIAINDDVDSENSRAGDDIIIPVKNIMNEAYCRELSQKLRKQFRIQRSNGEFLGAFANYGYCKSPDDKHKLVVDDYAAEVVRGIFSLKFQGYSQQAIADFLNKEQVLSPADYKKSLGLNYKTGFKTEAVSKWSAVTVTRILTNPIYIGTLVQGKRGTPNYKIKKLRMRDEKDWVVVENNHEPIIDLLTFNIVQQMLKRDTRTSPKKDIVYPLSGMVFCADCKASMAQSAAGPQRSGGGLRVRLEEPPVHGVGHVLRDDALHHRPVTAAGWPFGWGCCWQALWERRRSRCTNSGKSSGNDPSAAIGGTFLIAETACRFC